MQSFKTQRIYMGYCESEAHMIQLAHHLQNHLDKQGQAGAVFDQSIYVIGDDNVPQKNFNPDNAFNHQPMVLHYSQWATMLGYKEQDTLLIEIMKDSITRVVGTILFILPLADAIGLLQEVFKIDSPRPGVLYSHTVKLEAFLDAGSVERIVNVAL